MRFTFLLMLMLWCGSLLGQQNAEFQEVGDWNGDGVQDSLWGYHDAGSGFSGGGVVIINRAKADTLEMSTLYCFCAVRNLQPFSPKLLLPENKPFFEKMQKALRLPPIQPAEPALKWIVDGLRYPIDIDKSTFFQEAFYAPLQWTSSELPPPSSQSLLVTGKEFNLHAFSHFGEWPDTTIQQSGILTFSHYPLNGEYVVVEPQTESGDWQIFAGKHALQVKHGKEWAWAFITDHQLTGSPEKMRWKSISEVFQYGNYAFLLLDLPPTGEGRWWVMNLETGKYGLLKASNNSSVEMDGPFLKFRDKAGAPQQWEIKEIFKELDNLR